MDDALADYERLLRRAHFILVKSKLVEVVILFVTFILGFIWLTTNVFSNDRRIMYLIISVYPVLLFGGLIIRSSSFTYRYKNIITTVVSDELSSNHADYREFLEIRKKYLEIGLPIVDEEKEALATLMDKSGLDRRPFDLGSY